MHNEMIEKVKRLLSYNIETLPKGYALWNEMPPQTVVELLDFLVKMFQIEESEIARERSKRYVTDDYENGVRAFAIELVPDLIIRYRELNNFEAYRKLLGQKHIAYAFYHVVDANSVNPTEVLEDEDCRRRLYLGLTTFYRDFYGKFHDNEEAIRLLCKYYPVKDDMREYYEEIADALYGHIANAGTTNDIGYAFGGIEQISQYIHILPEALVKKLLEQYRLYDVINQKVYRHQIFAIIDGSGLKKKEKRSWKFFYLDSLMLANFINMKLPEEMRENDITVKIYHNPYDIKLKEPKLQVFEEPDTYWDNTNVQNRCLWIGENETIHMELYGSSSIVLSVNREGEMIGELPYFYADWRLDGYHTREMEQTIYNLITGGSDKLVYRQMTFSLLYLDNYRGLKEKTLDFDHRFICENVEEKKRFLPRGGAKGRIPHFYGETVYSLTCIVGKNGTGKTSIVDFLRETFFKLLKILEDFDVQCKNGCVREEDYEEYGILDKGSSFLVVFRLGEKDYYLTNIEDVDVDGAEPFQRGNCRSVHELSKVAYFSQQIRADQRELFNSGSSENQKLDEAEQKKADFAKTLNDFRQCNYSEAENFVRSYNALAAKTVQEKLLSHKHGKYDGIINRELCYQFSLLRNLTPTELSGYLEIPEEKEWKLYNLLSGEELKSFHIRDFSEKTELATDIEREYIRRPEVRIGYFSSGQYAKFSFLASLHWFLAGFQKDGEYYRELVGEGIFSGDDAMQQDETALIFIDEGELYYHPEWQRRYLTTLLAMIAKNDAGAKVQVILTTNSPFLISDVLKEDVMYLSESKKEFDDTLGQNIHKLLKDNFFMDYTIGEYSRELIEKIIGWLCSEDTKEKEQERDEKRRKELLQYFTQTEDEGDAIGLLIRQIGEPIYRKKLEAMLDSWQKKQKRSEKQQILELEQQLLELNRQKVEAEAKIAQLKAEVLENGGYDDKDSTL